MITVFGSINVDLVTRAHRIPRPGETVLGEDYAVVAGGKGANQALAARRAGAAVRLVGAVGDDGFAATALAELADAGVDLTRVARVEKATGVAFITVEKTGENAILVASGANRLVRAAQLEDVNFTAADTLLLQMEVAPAESFAAAERAKRQGARVVLTLAPFTPIEAQRLAAVDLLILNQHEALELAGHLGLATTDAEESARALAKASSAAVVTTLGAAGVVAASAEGGGHRASSLPVEAVDTTGAGDAFAGVLATFLDDGADLATALRHAVAAGALACTKPGAQPSFPTLAEIRRAMAS